MSTSPLNIQESVPLRQRCWYQTGGEARYFGRPGSLEELQQQVDWGNAAGFPLFLMGHGSNVLFADDGFDGLVICTTGLKATDVVEPGVIEVEAGFKLERLVDRANELGWQGLESFPGIPGTIGGAVWGNAGAGGEDIGDRVSQILLMEPGQGREWVDSRDLDWRYRYSGIEDRVVAAVRLRLNEGSDPQELKRRTAEVELRKRDSQPFALRSCGCIFRNPHGQSAGALIEKSGLKGTTLGRARVSIEHANFIVNEGGATSRDIEQLIERIRSHVKKLYSVDLEREVIMPGHRGGDRS